MKVFSILASIAIFFLVYWLLPNGKVPVRVVLPAAVIMGLLSEGAEVRLHLRAAPAEFRGSLWTVRHLGQPDVLGVSFRDAAVDWSSSLGAENTTRLT